VATQGGPSIEALGVAHMDGRRAWPGISLGLEAMAAHMQRLGIGDEALAARGADLFIATACAAGDHAAMVRFDAQYLGCVDSYVTRLHLSPELVGELLQQSRLAILLGPTPLIGSYRGSGPLLAWVRVIVMRTALALLRVARDPRLANDIDALDRLISPALGPDANVVKARYRDRLQAALNGALVMLSDHEKTLLRLHFIDGLGVDAIGRIYHVHRATSARWLVNLRKQVLHQVRRTLDLSCNPSSSELRSLVDLLKGEIEISLRAILG
jgi:RNA polymerase sigma-70 factor, ECF subfamily